MSTDQRWLIFLWATRVVVFGGAVIMAVTH